MVSQQHMAAKRSMPEPCCAGAVLEAPAGPQQHCPASGRLLQTTHHTTCTPPRPFVPAALELDVPRQRALLRAAVFGAAFCPDLPPRLLHDTCTTLRVLNAVRDPSVGLAPSWEQLEALGMEGLVARWGAAEVVLIVMLMVGRGCRNVAGMQPVSVVCSCSMSQPQCRWCRVACCTLLLLAHLEVLPPARVPLLTRTPLLNMPGPRLPAGWWRCGSTCWRTA
jgi:hypothetical protein